VLEIERGISEEQQAAADSKKILPHHKSNHFKPTTTSSSFSNRALWRLGCAEESGYADGRGTRANDTGQEAEF